MANVSFRLARIFAWIGLLSTFILIVGAVWNVFAQNYAVEGGGRASIDLGVLAIIGSGLTSLIAMMGTASTILLGWRSDRRQAHEFKLKIEQLELQLSEARKAASSKMEAERIAPA